MELLNAAAPPESGPEPICVAPSKKFTVPAGVPPEEVTVAVSVTFRLNVEGFSDDVKVVVVAAGFTVCEMAEEVEPAKLVEATYAAERLCTLVESEDVLKVAAPPESVPEPSNVAPSKKLTVPVGVPPVEATVAVNVTLSLNEDGFGADASVVVVVAGFTVCVIAVDVEAL